MSRSSQDSTSTNDDYVVVNGEPKLRITGRVLTCISGIKVCISCVFMCNTDKITLSLEGYYSSI